MTSVQKALAIAFCTQAALNRTGDVYRTVHENTPGLLSTLSSLVDGSYEWITYTTFHRSGGKQYLQIATAINAEWLAVRSPHHFFLLLSFRPGELTIVQELPFFQEARLPKTGNGSSRQPNVKRSLDDAKARTEASKENQRVPARPSLLSPWTSQHHRWVEGESPSSYYSFVGENPLP
jgi:hypothetical protein